MASSCSGSGLAKKNAKSSRRYCCVKDCHSREGQLSIRLYRFPGRPYERDRRQKWITAVRRINQADGSEWVPNGATRICSRHFVNGEKSTIATHPGYYPTIFPDVYRASPVDAMKRLSRYERLHQRRAKTSLASATPQPSASIPHTLEDEPSSSDDADSSNTGPLIQQPSNLDLLCIAGDSVRTTKEDKACQTNDHARFSDTFSVFLCSSRDNDACTQVNHKGVCDAEVQCKPPVVSRQSGRDSRTACFTGYDSVQVCAAAMKDLCGVSLDVFALLLSILPRSAERSCDVPMTDRLVLFLMKIKLGITYSSLGVLFSVSRNTVSRHFKSVLRTLSVSTQKWIYRPPVDVTRQTMPNCFKAHYKECSMIIDCTEVHTEQPCTVQQQRVLYSHYKGGYTLKFLVGITPCGTVCFRSKAYGGRCSDAFITVDSGFLELVQPGDVVMADKGFPGIRGSLEGAQAVLVMPPFLQGHDQFSESEVHETYHIAQVRIHVERIIQRIKMYNILNTRVPTELIPGMSDIFHVCCILANLQPPIIRYEK